MTIFAWDDQQIAPEKIHLTREEIKNTPSPSPNIVYKSGTLFRLQPSPFLDMQRKFSPSIGFKSFLKQLNCQAGLPLLQMFHIYLAYSVHHWLSLLSNSLLQDKYHHSKPERQLYTLDAVFDRIDKFCAVRNDHQPYFALFYFPAIHDDMSMDTLCV